VISAIPKLDVASSTPVVSADASRSCDAPSGRRRGMRWSVPVRWRCANRARVDLARQRWCCRRLLSQAEEIRSPRSFGRAAAAHRFNYRRKRDKMLREFGRLGLAPCPLGVNAMDGVCVALSTTSGPLLGGPCPSHRLPRHPRRPQRRSRAAGVRHGRVPPWKVDRAGNPDIYDRRYQIAGCLNSGRSFGSSCRM